MKMEQTECSETSAYKIQTQGNYPEESIPFFSRIKIFYVDVSTAEIIWRRLRHDRVTTKCMKVESQYS